MRIRFIARIIVLLKWPTYILKIFKTILSDKVHKIKANRFLVTTVALIVA